MSENEMKVFAMNLMQNENFKQYVAERVTKDNMTEDQTKKFLSVAFSYMLTKVQFGEEIAISALSKI